MTLWWVMALRPRSAPVLLSTMMSSELSSSAAGVLRNDVFQCLRAWRQLVCACRACLHTLCVAMSLITLSSCMNDAKHCCLTFACNVSGSAT